MTHDTNERHKVREYGRFPGKGRGKRQASKFKRRLAKFDITERRFAPLRDGATIRRGY